MTTQELWCTYAQLSQACYAFDLVPGGNNLTAYTRASQPEMSTFQASQFQAQWEVLQQSTVLNGFSATLFENRHTGDKVLAIAGTHFTGLPHPNDLLTDIVNIAKNGSIFGMEQYASLESFYDDLISQGHLTSAEQFTVTGHSLGGFLSQAFTALHPQVVTASYNFNTPGFFGAAGELADLLGLAPEAIPEDRITNVIAAGGPSATSGLGVVLGSLNFVQIEVADSASGNHAVARLATSLALQDVLVRLDPTLSQSRLNRLIEAASAIEDNALETLLDGVRLTLTAASEPTVPDPRSGGLYMNIDLLLENSIFDQRDPLGNVVTPGTLEGRLYVSVANEVVASDARTQFSALLALHSLSPLVLRGSDSSNQTLLDNALGQQHATLYAQWQDDLALSAEERADGLGNFSDQWIADRAVMLALLVRRNQVNAEGELDAVHSGGVAQSYHDLASGLQIDTGAGGRSQIVFGGAGGDIISGGSLADRLYGGDGADSLNGGGGDDYLEGAGGNDALTAGGGRDVLNGGEGFDSYTVSSDAEFVTIRDGNGAGAIVIERSDATTYTLGADTIREVEDSTGIYRDEEGNSYAFNGDDLLVSLSDGRRGIRIENFANMSGGRLGLDLLSATPVTLPGGARTYNVANPGEARSQQHPDIEVDGMYAGGGPSLLSSWWSTAGFYFNRNETEVIYASAAVDPTYGTAFAIVFGGFGDSHMFGDAGFNWFDDDGGLRVSHPLSEVLTLADDVGDDRIDSGGGNDWIITRGGDDVVHAGTGDDVIINTVSGHQMTSSGVVSYSHGDIGWLTATGNTSNDRLLGEAGNDYITGDGGEQFMDGGEDDDELFAGAGNDILLGGDGNDVLAGDLYLNGPAFYGLSDSSGYVYDVLFDGDELAADLDDYGEDILDGGDGDDTLFGGGGKDTLIGGIGNDRMQGDFRGGYADLRESLRTMVGEPLAIHGDDALLGGAGNDEIDGGGGNDVIDGGADNDTIVGGTGDDLIDGGSGVDTILGDYTNLAQGNDRIYGGADNDTILGMGGNDRLFGDAGNDDITGGDGSGSGSGTDWLEGGAGDDHLFGEDGDDTLEGGAGSDVLQGGDGNDLLIGSAGNDALYGEAGDDRFVLNLGTGPIQISDTVGVNTLDFGVGIVRSDIRVVMADFTTRIYFSDTDYAYMSQATFEALGLVRFANGFMIDASALRETFQPGSTGIDQNIVLNGGVATSEIQFMRRNDDLLLTYSGAVGNWVNTNNFGIRNVMFEMASGEQFGLPANTQVLVLTNWYRSSGQYLTTLFASGESPVNFTVAARAASGLFQGGDDGDALIGTAGADTLSGGTGADVLLGGAGNDAYLFAVGDGADAILDEDGSLDAVRFGAGIAVGDLTVTESDEGLLVQIGPPANGDSLLITDASYLSGHQQQPIERFEFAGGTVLDATQIRALVSGNRRPDVTGSLTDQEVGRGQLLAYELPAGLFTEPDGSQLSYSASLADGSALPSWLTFDPVTRTFTGSTSQSEGAVLAGRVTARDPEGLGNSALFTVTYMADSIIGTSGNDTLTGSSNDDNFFGRDGDDVLDGRAGEDSLQGEGGNDRILGGNGADRLEGGAGNDEIEGGEGSDTYVFAAGFGQDTVKEVARFGAGSDDDRIEFAADSGITLSDLVVTRSGVNLVIAVGTDQLTIKDWYGTARPIETFVMYANGLQYVYSSEQVDALVKGTDTAPRVTPRAPIVVGSGEAFEYTLPANAFIDTQSDTGVDTLTYSINGTLPAWLTFDPIARRLTGTVPTGVTSVWVPLKATDSGGNFIPGGVSLIVYDPLTRQIGGAADDALTGGTGSDFILGGGGNDTINLGASMNYADGEAGNDVITGGSLEDRLYGGDGNDTINGMGGSDIIDGGNGDDTVTGGEWTTGEEIRGGAGDDTIDGRGGEDDLFGDSGADQIFGGSGNDHIQGGSGADLLFGGTEVDTLVGGDGNDILDGGVGNDQLQGNEGDDTYTGFSSGTGSDFITSTEGIDTIEYWPLLDLRISNVAISRTGSGTSGNLVLTLGTSTITMSNAFAIIGERIVERYVLYYDDVPYTYTARQIEARANGLDGDPEAVLSFAPQSAAVDAGFSYVVPANAFTDVESQLTLTYSLTRADGSALPAWLTFDPATRTLSGTPSSGDVGVLGLRLNAQDSAAHVASSSLWVNVGNVHTDGTAGTDTLTGTSSGDALYGHAGNDDLLGAAGDDILEGGAGNDTIDGGSGNDWAYGGTGDDTYVVDSTLDAVKEDVNGGIDTIVASAGSVILGANVENLTLVGTATGGTGNDLDNRLIGNDQANLLIGDEGNDVIEGGDNTDDLRGGAGEDLLDGGLGNDAMNGGTGNDTYVVDSGLDSIVDTGTGIDTVLSSITYTLQSNLENLRLLGTTDLIAIGNTAANTIVGNSGSNIIDGGSNGDNMLGAAGDDSYTVDSLFDIVIEAQNEGTDSVQSSVAFTLGANVENLTLTSSAAGGTGNALDNTINGNSAANTLTGHGGNDTLNGGSGSDTMIGGTGNDTYVVAQAGDVVTENADEGTDTVQSSISYTLGNDVENLTLTSSATTGTGNGLDNVIVGNSSSNTLTGNGGNDTLDGGGGSDSLTGGAGNDSYFVAQTGDTVTEAVGGGTDTVNSTIAYTLSSTQEIENLTLLGSSNVNGTGNALNNVLVGNAGNNTLAGNAGSDTLTGGNGADIYSFSAGHGADTINNASSDSALDRLDVSGITSAQVAFTRSGNDLLMTRTGTPTDNVRVLNWFTDAGSQVDSVRFISNNVTLTAAQINAMFPSLMSSTERSLAVFVDAMNHFGGRRDFVVDRIRASDPEAQADWLAPAEAGSGLRFQGGPAERRQLV